MSGNLTVADTSSIVSRAKKLLVDGSINPGDYRQELLELGKVVSLSTTSDEYRESISSNPRLLEDLVDIVTEAWNVKNISHSIGSLYIRLFRGCLLLIRNIVASNQSAIDLPLFLLSLQHFRSKVPRSDPFFTKTMVAYFQTCSNITQNVTEDTRQGMDSLLDLVKETLWKDDNLDLYGDEVILPLLLFINNLFTSLVILYDLFLDSEKFSSLLAFLFKQFLWRFLDPEINPNVPHSPEEAILITIFQKMASHESYSKWFFSQDNEQTLKINQLVITEKEDWNNYQLTNILAWLYDLFVNLSKKSQELLALGAPSIDLLSTVHIQMVMTLDMLSDLGKFDATKQFLNHYNAIEELIRLLRVVHENVERRTLKKKIEVIANSKEFPQVKSLIIEIIASLAYQSFEVQEKVRELHGLELVLSNCVIDDNDPYIKERSIICVKLLLENNPKNQEFVASLEAKETYDDQMLQDVGYEVEIKDGKVKLKHKEGINESA